MRFPREGERRGGEGERYSDPLWKLFSLGFFSRGKGYFLVVSPLGRKLKKGCFLGVCGNLILVISGNQKLKWCSLKKEQIIRILLKSESTFKQTWIPSEVAVLQFRNALLTKIRGYFKINMKR